MSRVVAAHSRSGQGRGRCFTDSRLQSDANSTVAPERPLNTVQLAGPCGRVAVQGFEAGRVPGTFRLRAGMSWRALDTPV